MHEGSAVVQEGENGKEKKMGEKKGGTRERKTERGKEKLKGGKTN